VLDIDDTEEAQKFYFEVFENHYRDLYGEDKRTNKIRLNGAKYRALSNVPLFPLFEFTSMPAAANNPTTKALTEPRCVHRHGSQVQRELCSGEDASNRPDSVDRLFNLKKKALLTDLRHLCIFDKFLATVWTIEYQKRCLPHCYILLFLSSEDSNRLLDPRYIDRAVRAEIPLAKEDLDGVLTEIFKGVMIHGPCGADKPSAPCTELRNRQYICKKGFPKSFESEAIVGSDGYPQYRRRNNGMTAIKVVLLAMFRWIIDMWFPITHIFYADSMPISMWRYVDLSNRSNMYINMDIRR
jgi:hypothetical protein